MDRKIVRGQNPGPTKGQAGSYLLRGSFQSVRGFVLKNINLRQVRKQIAAVRLLAFLKEPTDDNHHKISADRGLDSPFSHSCNRGLRKAGQIGLCINNIHHSRFGTVAENASHKHCVNRARALYPGPVLDRDQRYIVFSLVSMVRLYFVATSWTAYPDTLVFHGIFDIN